MKRAFAFGWCALALSVACGSNEASSSSSGPNGPKLDVGSGARNGTGNGAGSGNGTGTGNGTGGFCTPLADEEGCVGEQYEGETAPLDVYVLFDQSCSMSCPISRGGPGQCCMGDPDGRIFPVRQAMEQFFRSPESAGIGFGLGFFGSQPVGQASCNPDDYETPAVPIALRQADTLVAALNAAQPVGETPTGAALRGACDYARRAKMATPGHELVILLVTDGIPETPATQCGATLADAVQAARSCAEDPAAPIKTYVLGVGQALQNLNQIAAAGGTKRAQLVEGGDAAKAVLDALNAIRGDASIPCELQIPPAPTDATLDYGLVNLGICDAGGALTSTVKVDNRGACGSAPGWYYDDAQSPTKIELCPASCDTVSIPGSQLYYSLGCQTRDTVR